MDEGGWLARLLAALFSAISASLLSIPVWWIGAMMGGAMALLLVGCALARAVGGLMGTGISRALLGDGDADRLCAWCVAAGAGTAMAISPVCIYFVHSRFKDISSEVGLLLVAAIASRGR